MGLTSCSGLSNLGSGLFSPGLLYTFVVILTLLRHDATGITLEGTPKSFARYPKWNACVNASISFEFKTTQDEGLLMYTDDGGTYDFVEVSTRFLHQKRCQNVH